MGRSKKGESPGALAEGKPARVWTGPERLDPMLDVVFRRLFDEEQGLRLLCAFVNAVLGWSGQKALVKLEALPTKAKGDNAKDKEAEFDVYAVDGEGRRYEIEIQLREQSFYANRALYYWSKMYAFQLDKSKDYIDLAPCLGIHLMNWKMWGGARRHHRFEVREVDTHERLTDHLALHMLEVPKYTESLAALGSEEERWLYFLRHGREMPTEEAQRLGEVFMEAHQRLTHVSQEEALRLRALSREKEILDRRTERRLEREHGRAEGRVEGERAFLLKVLTRRFGASHGWEGRVAKLTGSAQIEQALDLAEQHAADVDAFLAALDALGA